MTNDIVQDIITIVIGVSVVVINIITLTQMRDKYVRREELKNELNNYVLTTKLLEEYTRKSDCGITRAECIRVLQKDVMELRNKEMTISNQLINLKKILLEGDRKFAYISLLLRELCLKSDVSEKTIEDLKDIAFNHRDVDVT